MGRFHDFLMRFRLAATPGSATAETLADRSAELEAELDQPLRLLTEATEEATAIRARAVAEADGIRRRARARAVETLAQAESRAAEVREEGAVRARRRAEAEAARLLDAAQRRAAEVRLRAEERMPALVDQAVADVLRLSGDQDVAAGRQRGGGQRWASPGSPE